MNSVRDYFTLNNGIQIPCVGYGTWRTPEGEDTVNAVREAIACGFRHIDTAQLYGNEESVDIAPGVDQLEIHPYFTQKEAVAYCQKEKIQVQAWSPLGHGTVLQDETLLQIGKKYNKTAAQVALRWELQQDVLPISKSLNVDRMKQNMNIFDFNLQKRSAKLSPIWEKMEEQARIRTILIFNLLRMKPSVFSKTGGSFCDLLLRITVL